MNQPLMENEHVGALLAVMEQHHAESMKHLLDVIGYVSEVEKRLDSAVHEIAAMRREQGGSTNSAVRTLDANTAALRNQLAAIKEGIVTGCKNLLHAVKEKGNQAFSNAARFFGLRPALEALRKSLTESIKSDERAIAKISAASSEYHRAGQHIKNMGRALSGKEMVAAANPPGKLAKMAAAPFRAERACFLSARKSVDNALDRLARMEREAEQKPSIRKEMARLQAQIDHVSRSAPAKEVQHSR